MLASAWIVVLPHLVVSLIPYGILKWTSWEIEGPRRLLMNTLNRCWQANPHLIILNSKPLGSHMVGWKYPIDLDTPTMIGWTIVIGCTKNEVLGILTYLSTILASGGLTSIFPWIWG